MSVFDIDEMKIGGKDLVARLLRAVHDYDVAHQEFTLDEKKHLTAQFKIPANQGPAITEEALRRKMTAVHSAAEAVAEQLPLRPNLRAKNPVIDSIVTQTVQAFKGKSAAYDLARGLRKAAAAYAAQGDNFFAQDENAVLNEIQPTGNDEQALNQPAKPVHQTYDYDGEVRHQAHMMLAVSAQYNAILDSAAARDTSLNDGFNDNEEVLLHTTREIRKLDSLASHFIRSMDAMEKITPAYKVIPGINPVALSVVQYVDDASKKGTRLEVMIMRLRQAAMQYGKHGEGYFENPGNALPFNPVRSPARTHFDLDLV
jgi:hypothetical protein